MQDPCIHVCRYVPEVIASCRCAACTVEVSMSAQKHRGTVWCQQRVTAGGLGRDLGDLGLSRVCARLQSYLSPSGDTTVVMVLGHWKRVVQQLQWLRRRPASSKCLSIDHAAKVWHSISWIRIRIPLQETLGMLLGQWTEVAIDNPCNHKDM